MKKRNYQIYNNLPSSTYLKSNEKASKYFKDLIKFPEILGYDKQSGGFLVLHYLHAPSAFSEELPACNILKNLGYRVILLEELPFQKSLDVQIDDEFFEIKRLSHAKKLKNAILNHFRMAYKKADKLLIHIDQLASNEQLRGALYASVKAYPSVKVIWIIWKIKLYKLDKETILSGKYQFI